jgi:hypothetical protein
MKAGVLGFVQHGSLYPALRARPSTQRSPTRLLEELGSPHDAVARADSDYEHAAAGLFPKLLDRAQDARPQEQVEKLRAARSPGPRCSSTVTRGATSTTSSAMQPSESSPSCIDDRFCTSATSER